MWDFAARIRWIFFLVGHITTTPEDTSAPFVIELLFSVFCRPLFCVGLVYILYLCLLPAGVAKHGADGVVHSCDGVSSYHDGKLTGLSKFLALPIFQRLAPYTVGVYLVHYGPLVWVAYWYLPPPVLLPLIKLRCCSPTATTCRLRMPNMSRYFNFVRGLSVVRVCP